MLVREIISHRIQALDLLCASHVVIDCIGGMEIKVLSQTIFNGASEAAKKARGTASPKITYIYCSGTEYRGL